MEDKVFFEYKENEHLHMYSIKDKKQYYYDLDFIDSSITGRADAQIANTFIFEAKYLVINAIKLYELGYFDCAYYSLREAIEISTIMVYLVDIPQKEKEEKLKAWKNIEWFPMRNKMLEYLENNGEIFVDFKEKMNDYFEYSKGYIEKINKYVHKQGTDKLYTIKKWYDHQNKLDDEYYFNKFEKYLKFTIGHIAIMRLSIDPFPIILMDEKLYLKTIDTITEPYSQEFIDKYIDKKYIEKYKETELYKGYESYFEKMEEQSIEISNIIKEFFVDISKYNEILKQFHLLNNHQQIIVEIFKISCKISNIYFNGCPISYFSNTQSKKKTFNYSSNKFKEFSKSNYKINMKYENVYMSVFTIENDEYFLEHNEILNEIEIQEIEKLKSN